jgi:hypothetical protein
MQFSTLAFFACLFPTVANAQVAKFAAGWASDTKEVSILNAVDAETRIWTEKLATIKSAQNKELLIGLSGVINLLTFTKAKGKVGGTEIISTADASVQVTVKYIGSNVLRDESEICNGDAGTVAYPGPVTFSSRIQELTIKNTLEVTSDNEDLELELEGSVDVSLKLTTTAAHHFNFLAVDLPSGTYDIYACWDATADGSLGGGDVIVDGEYGASAGISQRMLTVQAVRAVKTDEAVDVSSGNIRRG